MRRLRIGVLGVMLAAAAALSAAHPAASGAAIKLLSIGTDTGGGANAVVIEASEPAAYAVARPDPLTVIIDLRGVVAGSARNGFRRSAAMPVASVAIDEMRAPDGAPLTRIALQLHTPSPHNVVSDKGRIRVSFHGSEPAAGSTRAVPGARVLSSIGVAKTGALTRVTLSGDGWLAPSGLDELPAPGGGTQVFVDLPGVVSVAGEPAAAGVLTGVQTALVSREPLVTRVTMQLAARTAFRAERAGDQGADYAVVFDPSAPLVDDTFGPDTIAERAPASPASPASPVPPAAPASPASPVVSDFARAAGTPAIDPMSALQQAPAPPAVGRAVVPVPQEGGARQYQGHNISLDLQGSALRDVLRLFANISGLNMVIDAAIEGSVDIILTEVPWDQALEIVLRTHNLGYSIDGTVVRIARLETLRNEEDQRAQLEKARAEAGELVVRTYALSYAQAQQIGTMLTQGRILSERGQTVIDPRTNTLIITDLAARQQTAEGLIRGLDRPEPQVEIEARIVQTSRDFARSIGIQWGLNGQVSPELGNTTPFAFPNNGTLTAGTDQTLEAPTSGVRLSLGAINGAFNLDVALQALERSGKGRILSTPRVTTQNNNAAEMYQGIQIPIQTVANNTITVTFKDAALSLRVTPQVTAAGTVIMQIELENATADFSRQVNGIPPIDTQRALTRVQINDGATTVIGGIFVSREQATDSRTPVLHRIPLLGWLFKRDETQDESRELLIFITPRILRS